MLPYWLVSSSTKWQCQSSGLISYLQNTAARLITGARRSQHVTVTLHQLHWLSIRQRILFKTAVLVYKCRHGTAPSYLSTYCMPTSSHDGRCHLRSAVSGQLAVPRATTNYGDRSFAVSGPATWNSLPAALRLLCFVDC